MPRTIEQIKQLAEDAHTFFCADTGEHLKIDYFGDDAFTCSDELGNSCEFEYTEVTDDDKFYELKEMV